MAISKALQDIYLSNPSGMFYMEALSLYHSALAEPLHITNNAFAFDARADQDDVRMIPVPFTIKMPTKDTSGSQVMQIAISNVEQHLIDDVESMARQPYQPLVVRYRIYINGKLNADGKHTQQLVPAWRMEATSIEVQSDAIMINASKRNMHNRRWPRKIYTTEEFPGLLK